MKVVVRGSHQEGANGDRATTKTKYKSYKVFVIRGDGLEFCAREWPGYDSFQSHVLPDALTEVTKYAEELARVCNFRLQPTEYYAPKREMITTWVAVK